MLTKSFFSLSKYSSRLKYLYRSSIFDLLPQVSLFSGKIKHFSSNLFESKNLINDKDLNNNVIQPLSSNVAYKEVSSSDIFNTVIVLSNLYQKIKMDKDDNKNEIVNIIFNLLKIHEHKLDISVIINIMHILIDNKLPNIQELLKINLKFIKKKLIYLTTKDYQELLQIHSKVQPNTLRLYIYNDLLMKLNLKISMDLDRNNFDFLISAFMNHKNDLQKINLALEAVSHYNFENVSSISIMNLVSAISYISHLPTKCYTVLSNLQLYLTKNIHKMKTTDILFVLHNLVYAVKSNKNFEFYNKPLLDNCTKVIISRGEDSVTAATCLNSLISLKHKKESLLDYTCEKYFIDKNNNSISFNEKFVLTALMNGFAQCRYNNEFIGQLMIDLDKIIKPYKSKIMLDYALNFAVFDHKNMILLNEIFNNEEFYFNVAGRKFISLWQKLKTIPNYNGPKPSEKCIKNFTICHTKTKFTLLPYLEKGLGSSIYIKTNLKTKLHHQIEYVTIFRNGGYPIAINNSEDNIEYIEDLQIPQNAKIVVIFEAPNYWYFNNSDELMGYHNLYIDSLKFLSLEVIPINFNEWRHQQENEKVPYLMKRIHNHLQSDKNFMLWA